MSEYKERDIEGMDVEGNYFCKHMSAMTGEDLHSKAAIAAELGYRDMRIDELTKEIHSQRHEIERLNCELSMNGK